MALPEHLSREAFLPYEVRDETAAGSNLLGIFWPQRSLSHQALHLGRVLHSEKIVSSAVFKLPGSIPERSARWWLAKARQCPASHVLRDLDEPPNGRRAIRDRDQERRGTGQQREAHGLKCLIARSAML